MSENEPAVPKNDTQRQSRELDVVALKALAHPLRVQIFDALSTYGNFTASGLAERFSESSGATSYHLRQLEKHGFVREVEGKGTGRERWWERIPGSISFGNEEAVATPAGRSAADLIYRQMRMNNEQMLADYMDHSLELPKPWRDASTLSTINTRLTVEELAEFSGAVMELADRYVRANRNQELPGSRPVHITFNAFPVIDGDATPLDQPVDEPVDRPLDQEDDDE